MVGIHSTSSANPERPQEVLGDATGFPDLEALKNMYQMVAQQLMNSRERYVKSNRYNKSLTMEY